MAPQTCLTVLLVSLLAGSAYAGIEGTKYNWCGCSITILASNTTCPTSPKAGYCDNALLFDEGCKLKCTADLSTPVGKNTALFGRWPVSYLQYDFIGCNNNLTVKPDGVQVNFSGVTCHINKPTNLCPDIPYINQADCPADKNCDSSFLKRWNNDLGTDQLSCEHGTLAIRENGNWRWNQQPYCSAAKTWANFSTAVNMYQTPLFYACVASKSVVNCTYPSKVELTSISADFNLHNLVNLDKMEFKNDSLFDGMRVSCKDGYQLAGFSSSNPTSLDLSFSWGATLNCASGASWVNSLTGSLPFDAQLACVVPQATCNCSFNKWSDDDFHGCRSDILRPIVGPYGCQLGCSPGYRMVGSFGRHGRRSRIKNFYCYNGWHGKRTLFDDDYAVESNPFATCEVDRLQGCPSDVRTFDCEFCDMGFLTWTVETGRLSCSEGVLIGTTSIEYSFSALNWFHSSKYRGGAWFGFDFYMGFSSTVAVPVFSCWTGEYEPSPIIHANATDSCSSCGFCFFKNNQPEESCVDGTLTLTYSSTSGTICQDENTDINAVISLSCTDGVWTLEGEIVDMDFPIKRCEGPILEETTVAEPEVTTVAEVEVTTEGAVEMHCDEEECSGCSWWGFESDPCTKTCVSAVLQIDFGMDFHVCSAGADFEINVNAMFCRNGSWFYLNAEGEISIDLGSNPLTSCQPQEPETRTCDKPGCGGCSYSFFPGFFPNEICYNGMLTLDFSFTSFVCGGAELEIGVNALFCQDGQWSYLTAEGSVSIDAPSGPLQTCLPPPPEPYEPEEECGMCGYKQYHGCGPQPTCSGGELELSYGEDSHICVGGTPINVDALFCKRGSWWYRGGWGHFPFFLMPFNVFQPCHPHPPQEYHCEHSGCDSSCSFWGFPWWTPRQSCSSGVFQIDFEVSQMCVFELDIHVEALFCQGGRWFSDVELSVEVTLGENPVTTCGGPETTIAPMEETTAVAVEGTTEEPGCQFDYEFEDCHGVVPVEMDCVEDTPSFSCGVEGDIMVNIDDVFFRFGRVSFLREFGWFAYDCFGRVRFVGFQVQFRCRLEDEDPSSGEHGSGSGGD